MKPWPEAADEFATQMLDVFANFAGEISELYALDQIQRKTPPPEGSEPHARFLELQTQFQKSLLARMIVKLDGTC